MLKKDNFWIGVLLGFVLPFVGYAIFLMIFDGLENMDIMSGIGMTPMYKERTCGILALALNAIPMNIYNKRRYNHANRGLILPTLIYVGVWVYYFKSYISFLS